MATALYEIVPPGEPIEVAAVDPLRYRTVPRTSSTGSGELLTVKLRYKAPDGDTSRLVTSVVRSRPQPMTPNAGFASAVAEFGMRLRGSPFVDAGSFETLAARARTFRGADPDGYRAEFIRLTELAAGLRTLQTRSAR